MNPVARFESFIERLMERTFARAAGSHLEPVEVSKRLVRAMETQHSVGQDGVIVPNIYDVYLSSADYEHFAPMRSSLSRNMESHLGRVARQRKLQMVSRPVVRLHVDRDLPPGELTIEPLLQDVPKGDREYQHTGVLPSVQPLPPEPEPKIAGPPNLKLGKDSFAVLRSPTKVGRMPDNDIVLSDKRVSRYHAEVVQKGERWVLRDVGSTNGTAVNGQIVREAALKSGDLVSLGGLEARWEQ